jgi:hypothetical protein
LAQARDARSGSDPVQRQGRARAHQRLEVPPGPGDGERQADPLRPYEPPKTGAIADTNAGIYRRSHRTAAATIVAEHRAAQRAMLRALRAAPPEYFRKQRSGQWPFDAVGHSAEHRRKHLEPLLARAPRAR